MATRSIKGTDARMIQTEDGWNLEGPNEEHLGHVARPHQGATTWAVYSPSGELVNGEVDSMGAALVALESYVPQPKARKARKATTTPATRPAGIVDLTPRMVELLSDGIPATLKRRMKGAKASRTGGVLLPVDESELAGFVALVDSKVDEATGRDATSLKALQRWLARATA